MCTPNKVINPTVADPGDATGAPRVPILSFRHKTLETQPHWESEPLAGWAPPTGNTRYTPVHGNNSP